MHFFFKEKTFLCVCVCVCVVVYLTSKWVDQSRQKPIYRLRIVLCGIFRRCSEG